MPEATTLFAGSQVIDPVFSRLDKFELSIPYTSNNHAILSDPERFWDLIFDTNRLCGGTGGCYRPGQETATRILEYRVFPHYWQIIVPGYLTRVSITLLRTLESRLPHETTGPVHYGRALSPPDRDAVIPILEEIPIPSGKELWDRGWFRGPEQKSRGSKRHPHSPKERYLGRIRFTDQLKKFHHPYYHQWRAFSYRQHIRNVLELWEEMNGIVPVPRTLEVAIDSWNSVKGTTLIKNFLPPWFDPRYLYHFVNGQRRKIPGPSPYGGNHEYSGYSRAGRKVYHSYVKEVGRWDRPLYRVETQFHRTFMREYCAREGIVRASDLLEKVSELAANHMRFARLDVAKLFRTIPAAQKWKLRRLSTRGQIHALEIAHGVSRKQISRFLVPIDEPIMTDQEVWNQY